MGKLPFEQKKREMHVRATEKVLDGVGCIPSKRPIEELLRLGMVNIDKPAGPTSHTVVDWAKKILHVKRTGHAGTLDPNVTGLLPTGLNDATKALQALLPAGKEYVCLMRLHAKVTKKDLNAIFKEFTTKIYQRPPVKSAVKRSLRLREIYYIDLLEISGKDVLFKVGCEAGTYIRRLCHDLGAALGVGAHMQQLRRQQSAAFTEETAVTLQDIADAYHFWKEDGEETQLRHAIQPVEAALAHLPRVVCSDHAVDALCHGTALAVPGVLQVESEIKPNDLIAVFTQKGEAIMMGRAAMSTEEILKEKHGVAVKAERVIMREGTYPKYTKG